MNNKEVSLYEERKNIYAERQYGVFYNIKLFCFIVLISFFYMCPWIYINLKPIILFDLPNRIFYIFGLVFFPKDLLLLSYLLIISILLLFFITILYGRIWCGYLCPQTLWVDLFSRIEYFIEGNKRSRINLDKQKISNINVLFKKISKHVIWFLISLFTAITFVGYFIPIKLLILDLITLNFGSWEIMWVSLITLMTYINAGWLREQVCFYMCPYARFQSSMFDADTINVTYNYIRGELRGKRSRLLKNKPKDLGDCINCYKCKNVCPTGIDIRDGLQMECINCGACVDACNEIMQKMNYPKNLISYSSSNSIVNNISRVFRPKVFVYIFALSFMILLFSYFLYNRVLFDVNIIKDRNILYRELSNGVIENIYMIKLRNMSDKKKIYSINLYKTSDVLLKNLTNITVEPYEFANLCIHLELKKELVTNVIVPIYFKITDFNDTNCFKIEKNIFINPLKKDSR